MSPSADAPKCPVCGKPQDSRARPFCSRRCADVDLNRWFKGNYAIPSREPPDSTVEFPEDAEPDE
jgi:endogenous inhibitor of DNA gyrase (YacG/DUF329 family)